jgi:hypothetical protein
MLTSVLEAARFGLNLPILMWGNFLTRAEEQGLGGGVGRATTRPRERRVNGRPAEPVWESAVISQSNGVRFRNDASLSEQLRPTAAFGPELLCTAGL